MTYRYIRKKKWKLALILITFGFLYIWTDGFGSYSIPLESYEILNIDSGCRECRKQEVVTEAEVDVDILQHLHLHQALRFYNDTKQTANSSASQENVCKRPTFDLKHDSVKYAFFSMERLNCSRQELFYIDNGVFKFNATKLGARPLKKCAYFGIERSNDFFSTYTSPLIVTEPPFDLILKHDFVRIKCFLKNADDEDDNEDDDNEDDNDVNDEEEDLIKQLNVANDLEQKSKPDDTAGSNNNRPNISPDNNHTFQNSANALGNRNNASQLFTVSNKNTSLNTSLYYSTSSLNKSKLEFYHPQKFVYEIRDLDDNEEDVEQRSDYVNNDYGLYDSFLYRDFEYEEQADFDQLLVQVYPKPHVFQRIEKLKPVTDFQQRPNILMLGLDSMSHLSYRRKLPKTYDYLKQNTDTVILNGYNIVGDATVAALVPILTGKTEHELPDVRRDIIDSDNVDVYPFIWNNYRELGYVTMLAEDEPSIGTFNLRMNGFRNQPTDHYMRPFWLALWETDIRKDSPRYCTGNVPNHMYLLNYTRNFFDKYSNVSKFAFSFGAELTHWDNNPGEYMDGDIVTFLEYFRKKGYLDNTVVILFADHGARYSRVRNTVQGKMEERLPMMSLMLPPWFKQKYPQLFLNLQQNADKLTTPFDLHETLYHLLHLDKINPKKDKIGRAYSLLQPVPSNRTCSSAHIDVHWCTCLKQFDLDLDNVHVQKSVNALMSVVNKETDKVREKCFPLKFKSLQHAYLVVPNEKVLMFRSSDVEKRITHFNSSINVDHAHFQVTIETSPNNGIFESTIQVNMTAGTYTVLESQISRLDRYGNQPACIQDKYPSLRKYCYCRELDNG